jgi:hypothetical protein
MDIKAKRFAEEGSAYKNSDFSLETPSETYELLP